jgi:putative addiction module CopG family antidote
LAGETCGRGGRCAAASVSVALAFAGGCHGGIDRARALATVANLAIFGEISEIKPVPTRNVSLTPEQDAFIDEMLKAGEYRNASEAMRDAIRALQQRRAEEALKLDRLRVSIEQGVSGARSRRVHRGRG